MLIKIILLFFFKVSWLQRWSHCSLINKTFTAINIWVYLQKFKIIRRNNVFDYFILMMCKLLCNFYTKIKVNACICILQKGAYRLTSQLQNASFLPLFTFLSQFFMMLKRLKKKEFLPASARWPTAAQGAKHYPEF